MKTWRTCGHQLSYPNKLLLIVKRFNFLFVFLSLLLGCKNQSREEAYKSINETALILEFKKIWNDTNYNLYCPKDLRFYDTLSHFYKNNGFRPIWFSYIKDTNFIKNTKFWLKETWLDGLKPQYYYENLIINGIKNFPRDTNVLARAIEFEIYYSDAILGYYHDKVLGRLNPKDIFGSSYMLPRDTPIDYNLLSVLNINKFVNILQASKPVNQQEYEFLKQLLKTYLDEEANYSNKKLEIEQNIKLEPGDTSGVIVPFAKKLQELKYITTEEYLLADSIYTKEFSEIIKRIQQEAGLANDGIIGWGTLGYFNQTFEDKINEIRANMERSRWFNSERKKPYAIINIPDYTLKMYFEDSTKEMSVCVGKKRPYTFDSQMKKYKETGYWRHRPKDHQTPQIASILSVVVLNPTWSVPRSIVAREMYHQIVKDPSYLVRNNYKVMDKGIELDPYSIDWNEIHPTKIPYKFVQQPGEKNALGKVKFLFRNPFSIYLHDTPLKSKFKLTERAVSHGCVRLQEPAEFANFLLHNNKGFNTDSFKMRFGQPPSYLLENDVFKKDTNWIKRKNDKTKVVYLKNRIPIYFDYKTIFKKENRVVFRNDVYGQNKKIIGFLEER